MPTKPIPGTDDQPYVYIEIKGGAFVCVPNNINLLTPYILLEQEDWFEDEIKFMRKLLRPGMRVVDIGASYGTYGLTAAKCVGDGGQVWLFEPSGSTANYLARAIEKNSFTNARLIRAGLSDKSGKAALKVDGNTEYGSIAEVAVETAGHEPIDITTLDECLERYGMTDIDFMKIDAEEHESKVILGGEKFLRSISPLIMYEIRAIHKLNYGLVDELGAFGYSAYRLAPGMNLLVPFDPLEEKDSYQLNLFSCKPDRAASLEKQGFLASRVLGRESVPVETGIWSGYLRRFPYGEQLARDWERTAQEKGGEDNWKSYQDALDCYVLANNLEFAPAERYGYMLRAYKIMHTLVNRRATFCRLLSFVRIAGDLGLRGMAVHVLKKIHDHLSSNRGVLLLSEPFLAPSAAHEIVDPRAKLGEWVIIACLEQLERLHTFSSYSSPNSSVTIVGDIKKSGFQSPEMERRRQLINLRFGVQDRLEHQNKLAIRSPDNLNPQFWLPG